MCRTANSQNLQYWTFEHVLSLQPAPSNAEATSASVVVSVGPQRFRTTVVPLLLVGRNPNSVLEPVSGGSVGIALRPHPDRRAEEFGKKHCRSRIVAQQLAKLLERVGHVTHVPSNGVVEPD